MGAVKKAFKKIGKGIKSAAKGIAGGIKGVCKIAGGALTFNPRLLKEGAKDFDKGVKNMVSGVGQMAGAVAGAAVGMTPLGAAINALTHGAASRLTEKVFTSTADTINNGLSGAAKFVDGVAHGDMGKALSGALSVAELASFVVPGAGAAAIAANALKSTAKDMIVDAVVSKVPINGIRC